MCDAFLSYQSIWLCWIRRVQHEWLWILFLFFRFLLKGGEGIKNRWWRRNRSYRSWSGDRLAQKYSGDQLPDYDMNPKLPARTLRHWKQTHSRNPLPARQTESGIPPLQSQRDECKYLCASLSFVNEVWNLVINYKEKQALHTSASTFYVINIMIVSTMQHKWRQK